MRWGVFWKRLTGSLEHSALIIEGAMRIHNFLVDYRDAQSTDESTNNMVDERNIERDIFENDIRK